MSAAKSYGQHRDREARVVTAVVALPCAAAVAGSVVPGLDDLLSLAVVGLVVVAVLALLARLGLRRLRERAEDRADAHTAAAWRAHHHRTPSTSTSTSTGGRAEVA